MADVANDPQGQSGSQSVLTAPQPEEGAPSSSQPTTPQAPSWWESLPEGLRAEPSLQAFKGKSLDAVVESYVNAQKLIGSSIRVPGKDASPEEVAKWREEVYNKLGRPPSPDKYSVKLPGVEGVEFDEGQLQEFYQVAHRIGLNNQQVEELLKYDALRSAKAARDQVGDFRTAWEALEKGDEENPGWGSMTDRYVAVAQRALATTFPPKTVERILESGLGNDPSFIRGLYRLGKEALEDLFTGGEPEGGLKSSQAAAAAELEKIMSDPKHPYFDASHPDHEKAVYRVLDLRRFVME